MMLFVIFISIVSLSGSKQASIVDKYSERNSPSMTNKRNIQSHIKRHPFTEEQYQRLLSDNEYYPRYDKVNSRRYRTINSKPINIIFQPHIVSRIERRNPEFRTRNSKYTKDRPRIQWLVEKNKRITDFPNNQELRSGHFFGENNRRSLEVNEQNDFGKYSKDTHNNHPSRRDHSHLKRNKFKENPQTQERLKNYDILNSYSSELGDNNGNFDEKDKYRDEYAQTKRTLNNFQDANQNIYTSGSKNKEGLLFRKISQVQYIIRNDQDAIDLLNKDMTGDIFSAIKNLQAQTATAIYDSNIYTEIVEMEKLKDERNDWLKTLNEVMKNVPHKSQEHSGSETDSPFQENDKAAYKQKFRFTNGYYPSDGKIGNINENSNNAIYEYDDELSEEDLNRPQSNIASEKPPTFNQNPQPENENAAFPYLIQPVTYGSNVEDEHEDQVNNAVLDYEIGKPSIIAHFVPSEPGESESSATTSLPDVKQDISETDENELAKISPGDVQVPSVQEDVHPRIESATVPDIEAEPPAYESDLVYNMKYPPVVPKPKETNTETNITKRLMHIRPPHRMKTPEIQYRRRRHKVSRGRRSPINRDPVLKRRSRRQIDVEEVDKRRTWNVPVGDCCHNGGTCFTSHRHSPQGIPSRWCECLPSFQGRFCEEDVNECVLQAHPCKEYENCTNVYGGFTCECQAEFVREGDDCIPVVTCEEFPCLNGAECVDKENGHFRCICPLGFVGRICDTRVDECEDASCSKSEICVSTETGFKCEKIDDLELQ